MSEGAMLRRRVGDLHVQITGAGRSVLLIHGNSGDLHYFDRIVPLLSPHRRIVAMDCRGQGRSARGTGPLTIARMAADAADVIHAVADDDEPVDVVGFSDGANVAMTLAARHPGLVRGLVLNAGNMTTAGLTRTLRLQLHTVDLATRWRVLHRGRLALRHELIRLMLDDPGLSEHDLRSIAAPTLVVVGSRDVIRPAHSRRIADLIPAARLRVVEGGTHFALHDMPDVVGPLIAGFLDTVDATSHCDRRCGRESVRGGDPRSER